MGSGSVEYLRVWWIRESARYNWGMEVLLTQVNWLFSFGILFDFAGWFI